MNETGPCQVRGTLRCAPARCCGGLAGDRDALHAGLHDSATSNRTRVAIPGLGWRVPPPEVFLDFVSERAERRSPALAVRDPIVRERP